VTNALGAVSSSAAVVIGLTNPPPWVTFNDTNWVINDNGNIAPAITTNGLLTLTDGNGDESSSAFYAVGQYVGGFIASFTYQTTGGADGVTFCVQDSPAGANALGAPGGALGYQGIAPSVAFEINIFASAHGGIGIRAGTNGSIGDFSNIGYVSPAPVNLTSGDNIYVQLYYLAGVMQVLLSDPSAPATYVTNLPVDVPFTLGSTSAYIGFTGADGGTASIQTVSNLLYSYTTPPILAIAPGAAGRVVVSWPVSVSSLFSLVQSSSLTGPWVPVAPVSSGLVGLQNQVILNAGGEASFYKLQLNDPNAP
jgi:hypothetical protein